MGRAVDARDEEGPERTCAVTRAKGDPANMLRFVLGPDARVTPDVARRLPGRGVWLTAERDIVAKAVANKAFQRGFKGKSETPAGLADEVDDLLARDALQWLSLANKAGRVVTGFAKVEAAIGKAAAGKAAISALFHASDAGADGVEKLGRALGRGLEEGAVRPPTIGIFNSEQLDLALGRPHVIHAALTAGTTATALLSRCRRLARYRGIAGRDTPPPGDSLRGENRSPDAGPADNGQLTNGHRPGIANE